MRGLLPDSADLDVDVLLQRISELEADNARLSEAQRKGDEAINAKSEFLAAMSHEIRTPLTAVIGMTGLLEDTVLTIEQQDYVKTLGVSAQCLLAVVNDILDFSKIESGKVEPESIDFHVADMIDDVIDIVALRAREQKTRLSCTIDGSVPEVVCGDLVRIRQILMNLCSNAVKFTRQGEVEIKVAWIFMEGDHGNLEFRISDTGIGMSGEVISRLFEPFEQATGSTARQFGGTGLGLAICARLVNLLGGDIAVSSREGEGSVFVFSVNVTDPLAGAPSTRKSGYDRLLGRKILIVDEHELDLQAYSRACMRAGMAVYAFNDFLDAAAWLRRAGDVDAVVAGVGHDGRGESVFFEAIHGLPGCVRSTILVLSADAQDFPAEDRSLIRHLEKPVRGRLLIDALVSGMSGAVPGAGQAALPRDVLRMAGLRALIADDNDISRKVATKVLARLGVDADAAENGIEVLALLAERKYDVVFMDMQMPVMSGLDCVREIRKRYGKDVPKVIALTANALVEDREKCMAAGMDGYLAKPYSQVEIAEALHRLLKMPSILDMDFSRTLDPCSVSMLCRLYDDDAHAMEDLIASFVARFPAELQEITEAVNARDFPKVALRAHKLKGTAGTFGASGLAIAAARLEESAKGGAKAACASQIQDLVCSFEAAYIALRDLAYIHKLGATAGGYGAADALEQDKQALSS